MGKRFYCDYCDKSFPYNIQNRKKHFEGLQHQNNRNAFFSKFKGTKNRLFNLFNRYVFKLILKEPKEILLEESIKKPCFRFFTTGDCQFGDQCRSSHKTIEELESLYEQFLSSSLNNQPGDVI